MRIVLGVVLGWILLPNVSESAIRRQDILSKLPLRFEENSTCHSQRCARYIARGANFELNLASAENWLTWNNPVRGKAAQVRTRLIGANAAARLEPDQRLSGSANYFFGSTANWRTDVTGYGRIRSRYVYPGIDLVFHGQQGSLEYDFVVAPESDPSVIRLELSGVQRIRLDADGDLVVSTAAGDIRWKHPEIYQNLDGIRRSVPGRFAVQDRRIVQFEIGAYDHRQELIIDPTLSYLTYLGGSRNDAGRGIAVDAAGNTYIAGISSSPDLPVISAFQTSLRGQTANFFSGDAFVAKFSPAGTLVYLTYLGGTADDGAWGVAVDSAGNAYVTGFTTSSDFPTLGPYQATFGGLGGSGATRLGDAFVAKLNPSGNRVLYSTFLGGNRDDVGTSIAIDSAGNAYISGSTQSPNFPVTSGAYQSILAGVGGQPPVDCCNAPLINAGDVFVAKLDPSGAKLVFSTLLGGSLDDFAFSIGIDSTNNVYVAGYTLSLNFPTTQGAFQTRFGGEEQQNFFFSLGDGFVAKLNPAGTQLVYSTLFGGFGDDWISAIAVDRSGNVYMTGSTSSANLATKGAFQPSYAGYIELPDEAINLLGDAFVAELNPAGSALVYLSYLGGGANDAGQSIAVDASGNAFVSGFTASTNFPTTSNALQPRFGGSGGEYSYLEFGDGFVAEVSPGGTTLLYSTYLGGQGDDTILGLALDGGGGVHVVGTSVSRDLKPTSGAVQTAFRGSQYFWPSFLMGDAFYSVISGFSSPPTITKVANAQGEDPAIAPNTWIFVKGSGLGPQNSRIWLGSDFVNNRMPTALDGVSVTIGGKSAFVYYISATQINVLTPPDLPAGPAQVLVTNGGVTSAAFTVQVQPYSTSFFVFNGGPYVIAVHLDGSLIGPATLFPGASTPVKPGETFVLFANGFGPTNVPIVTGSAGQGGSLAVLPKITIGGLTANVQYAGLVSPGLYQVNIDVPTGAPDGDNPIQATYNGATTQAGTLLTVRR